MKFGQYIELFEDVPVGLKNKEIWFDYLKEKYSKSKDLDKLFISFVNVDKVGINPKSPYDTPIGVYTYPLDNVIAEGDEKTGVNILRRAIEEPIRRIAENAGIDGAVVAQIDKILSVA